MSTGVPRQQHSCGHRRPRLCRRAQLARFPRAATRRLSLAV